MRLVQVSMLVLTLAATVVAQSGSGSVHYVPRDQTFLKDNRIIAAEKGQQQPALVMAQLRDKGGRPEFHDNFGHVLIMLEGEVTYVTGGKVIGWDEKANNGTRLGQSIEGGQVHNLKAGDVLSVPPGVPHWFKETVGGKPAKLYLVFF